MRCLTTSQLKEKVVQKLLDTEMSYDLALHFSLALNAMLRQITIYYRLWLCCERIWLCSNIRPGVQTHILTLQSRLNNQEIWIITLAKIQLCLPYFNEEELSRVPGPLANHKDISLLQREEVTVSS